jgi:hypothetical protein
MPAYIYAARTVRVNTCKQIYSANVTFQSSAYLLEYVLFAGSEKLRLTSGKMFFFSLFVDGDTCSFLLPQGCQ